MTEFIHYLKMNRHSFRAFGSKEATDKNKIRKEDDEDTRFRGHQGHKISREREESETSSVKVPENQNIDKNHKSEITNKYLQTGFKVEVVINEPQGAKIK